MAGALKGGGMPISTYIQDPAHGFTAAEQAALLRWYADFAVDDAWRLIGRNVDRECDRQDIRHHVMRADHVLEYQMHAAGIAITMRLGVFVAALQGHAIGGRDLIGSHLGRADYPVWVCPADQRPGSADDCRDRLGLHHVHHGHMVAVSYATACLDNDALALRAPTALDAAAAGAENWMFAKRRPPGGPTWGHAVDLGTSTAGIDEAVHGDFRVDGVRAARIDLAYVGQIRQSSPQVDFATLLVST